MQNNIIIRHAIESDEPFTLDVRYKAWLKAYNHIFSEENIHKHFQTKLNNPEYRANTVKRLLDNPYYYVACVDNKPVAILILKIDNETPSKSEIVCFYCYPEYQRLGIGKKLFDYAVNVFKQNNIKSFEVNALKDNFVGGNFYLKNGGKIVDTHKETICYTEVDCVIYKFDVK